MLINFKESDLQMHTNEKINSDKDTVKNENAGVNENTPTGSGQKKVVRNGGQKENFGGQKQWSENFKKTFELLKEKPQMTRKELAETLKINTSAIQKHIQKLKQLGIIERVGSDKKGFWRIIK